MKYYLILGVLVLMVIGLIADSTRGNDPRWVRDDQCIEGRTSVFPCFVYTVRQDEKIARFLLDGKHTFVGFLEPGVKVIYSPVFQGRRGPVFTDVIVTTQPGKSGDYTGYIVKDDSLPPLPT